MKLLTEVNSDSIDFITEDNNGVKEYYIEGIFLQADIKNGNGRVYPMAVLESEVDRYNTHFIEKKKAYGELDHPPTPSINLDRASHIIKELRQEGSNFVGKAKIIDTPNGRIVKALMDEGCNLGVSSRAVGSIKKEDNALIIQNDLYISTPADIVANPSAPDAYVESVMESSEWVYDESLGWQAIQITEETRELAKSQRKRLSEAQMLEQFNRFMQAISS